jgi:hypothetical protein
LSFTSAVPGETITTQPDRVSRSFHPKRSPEQCS